MEYVPLLFFSLGDKFEGPKKRSKQKPASGDKDKGKDKTGTKNLSYYLRKMIYEIWNLNQPFLKPTAKVYSQNHFFQDLKEGLSSLVFFGGAVKAAGRAPPKLSLKPLLP